jgi:mannonate dehydratase
MDKTVLGKEGREQEIETVKQVLRNLGRVGVPVYCWAWTHNPLGVLRTSTAVSDRGGSLQTGYDHEQSEQGPTHPEADITEAELWENLEYFLEEVVPVAEEAGVKMALHPDDPPISPVRGVPRIITSVEEYDRALDLYPSDHHGVTFCQGNFSAMGVDIPETIRHFGEDIHFVHFRDVEGTAESFSETWHDDGPTDMVEAVRAYQDVGFDGPLRPDHVPTLATESNDNPGYEMMGRLYAIGYVRALWEAVGHPSNRDREPAGTEPRRST